MHSIFHVYHGVEGLVHVELKIVGVGLWAYRLLNGRCATSAWLSRHAVAQRQFGSQRRHLPVRPKAAEDDLRRFEG